MTEKQENERLRQALERVLEECGKIHFQRSNVYRIVSTALSDTSQHQTPQEK